ncbi:hypothetical protein QQF64_018467 [Cirrhinus molitorella]|uniref:Uncharacterized protein n=1 Tax=Cirrhinus molitorella TaxID=172907 RepID=A0ABR3LCM9_9TELE
MAFWNQHCIPLQQLGDHNKDPTTANLHWRLRNATRQCVIVARNDGVTIPVDDGLTCAVDKLYWVCNVSYPPQLSSVFTFFVCDVPINHRLL